MRPDGGRDRQHAVPGRSQQRCSERQHSTRARPGEGNVTGGRAMLGLRSWPAQRGSTLARSWRAGELLAAPRAHGAAQGTHTHRAAALAREVAQAPDSAAAQDAAGRHSANQRHGHADRLAVSQRSKLRRPPWNAPARQWPADPARRARPLRGKFRRAPSHACCQNYFRSPAATSVSPVPAPRASSRFAALPLSPPLASASSRPRLLP